MKGIQDSSSMTFRQLMGNGVRYEIPQFQRDYSWEEEQWEDLWQDLQYLFPEEGSPDNEAETGHYMGYLVLQTKGSNHFIVIDGQQRLTTLSLLVLAVLGKLRDMADRGIDPDDNRLRQEALYSSYIGSRNPETLLTDNKLTLNRNGNDYYKWHLATLQNPLPERDLRYAEKQMRKCFLWFSKKLGKVPNPPQTPLEALLAKEDGAKLARIVQQIADRLFFTVIRVGDELNAFAVFETLNARGVQLSASDLLKNYLFSLVSAEGLHRSEMMALEEMWNKIMDKLGNDRFEDFLRHYWNSRHKSTSKNRLFKTIKDAIKTRREAFELLRALLEAVDVFRAIQDPHDELWRGHEKSAKAIALLNLFGVKQHYGVLMSAYLNLRDMTAFERLAEACAIISFRYNIIGKRNPNEQEKAYNRLAVSLFQEKQMKLGLLADIYVEDANFVNDFANKSFRDTVPNRRILKYIFSKLEWQLYEHSIDDQDDTYTIEHILPKNAPDGWGGMSGEAIARAAYRLGNLSLLEHQLNRKAADKPFAEKRALYAKSNCQLSKQLADKMDWDEDRISARQKELAKAAKSIWHLALR